MKKILLSVLTVLALVSCVREGIPEEPPLRSYDITAVKSYGSLEELLNETGYSMMGFGFLLSFYFPDYDKPVSAISYTYLSEDPQGKPVELSALLYIPDAALNGTTVLHTLALLGGAHILRVHDVKEAVQAVRICRAYQEADKK
jgi:hypothetical protein